MSAEGLNPRQTLPPGMTRTHYWFVCAWEFLLAWFGSRNYTKLLLGVPAVLLGCLVLGGVISRPYYTLGKKIDHYRTAAVAAIEEGDTPVATMCLEKLWQLEPANHGTLFALAVQLNALEGADATTVEFIHRLAPKHEPRYAAAHRWVARSLLASPKAKDSLPTIHTHLQHSDAVSTRDAESDYLWFVYFSLTGETQKAASHLSAAAKANPALAFTNMQFQTQANGDPELIRRAAIDADAFLSRLIDGGSADVGQHLQLAVVLETLDRPARLVELARTILDRFPDNEEAKTWLAGILDRQLEAIGEKPDADINGLLDLAVLLREVDPRALTKRLDAFLIEQKEPLIHRRFVDRLLNHYDATGDLAEDLGEMAAQRKDLETAERLFEVSIEKDPKRAPALNNLAWILQRTKPDQLERALDLANRALDETPNQPSYRETRGQILVRLERWQEGADDLKFALNVLSASPETHTALAKALRELGKVDQAEFHEQQAERLK